MKKLSIIISLAAICGSLCAQAQDISLKECLEMGANNDVGLRNARLDVLAAKEQQAEARWEYVPRVSLSGFGYYALNPLLRITVKDVIGNSDAANEINNSIQNFAQENGIRSVYTTLKQGWAASAVMIQPLYTGGRIFNGNKLANLGVEAAGIQSRLKEKESSRNIEKKYWTAVSLQEKQLTLSQAQALLDSLYKDASNAFEAGLIVENDLRQVEEKMDELKSAGIKLRGGLRLAKMDLFNSIGYEYSILGLDSLHFSDSIDSLQSPSYYIVEDSELPVCDESRLLALKVQAEQLEKKMAVGENLPQVMVGASYGYNNIQGKPLPTTNGVGFVSVQIPITDIGKAAHKAKRYNYQIEKAQNEKEYLDAQLVLRRQMYMLSMQTAWEELQLSEAKAANAVSRAIRAESEYKAGRSTVSEWLKAELDSRTASEDYINRCIDYRNAVRDYLDCL